MPRDEPGGDAPFRLAEIVGAISLATDLGTGLPMERGIRAGLAAVRLAEVLGLTRDALSDVYYTQALVSLGGRRVAPGRRRARRPGRDRGGFCADRQPCAAGSPRQHGAPDGSGPATTAARRQRG